MKNVFTRTLLSSLLLTVAGGASAAAFQLAEVSTTGLGRAYAGEAAIADNASVVATNPALMSLFKRPELAIGAVYVDPSIDISGATEAYSHKNIAPNATIPNLYAVYPINDKFAVGGGVNVNYGLSTKYNDQYAAGFIAGTTELKTVNLNLSGSYRIGDKFSAGLGFNAVHADALLERHAGVLSDRLGRLKEPLGVSNSTVIAKIEGDKWGYGWNAGLVYELNENNRIGAAYHSHITLDFKGDYSNSLPTALTGPYAGYDALYQQTLSGLGLVPSGGATIPGSLKLALPAFWEISGYHKVGKLAFHYSYKYTEWSRFKELRAKNGAQLLFQKTEEYRDSTRLALGTSYDVNDQLTLRFGIAYDESAAQNHHTLSIPDTDRTWYSLGATYRFTDNLSVDAAFAHLRGAKNRFTENNIEFTSKARANLYGLNLNYRF